MDEEELASPPGVSGLSSEGGQARPFLSTKIIEKPSKPCDSRPILSPRAPSIAAKEPFGAGVDKLPGLSMEMPAMGGEIIGPIPFLGP